MNHSKRIFFIKQLATLRESGVPLLQSLYILQNQATNSSFKKMLQTITQGVEQGQYLSHAMMPYQKMFGQVAVQMISVGEISGTLGQNLTYLAQTLKKQQALKRKIISASIYPVFIIIATMMLVTGIFVFIFPKILPVFNSLHYQLPWPTRCLIFLEYVLRNYGLWLLLGLAVFTILGGYLFKKERFRVSWSLFLLRVPIISGLITTYYAGRVSQILGMLLKTNVGIIEAFTICANTSGNRVYKKQLHAIAQSLSRGEKVSFAMNHNPPLFPALMVHMIEVGETSGKLSETFLYLAQLYEEELDEVVKNSSTMLEPILLLVMGLLVGFITVSMILPIYGITQHIR